MTEPWYKLTPATEGLTQGDIVLDCPLATWKSAPIAKKGIPEVEILSSAIEVVLADVVVLTQVCDLAQNKIDDVILCPHLRLDDYKGLWAVAKRAQDQKATNRAWERNCEDICDGFIWNLSMLNSGEDGGLKTEHRVVDFHYVYTLPRAFLESLIVQRGKPRLRLLPPYREHLSQAFARYFMRVGLPENIKATWK